MDMKKRKTRDTGNGDDGAEMKSLVSQRLISYFVMHGSLVMNAVILFVHGHEFSLYKA
jgi:hypothetical protein